MGVVLVTGDEVDLGIVIDGWHFLLRTVSVIKNVIVSVGVEELTNVCLHKSEFSLVS